ncbi:hypothetical protein EII22_08965 [Coriobacteriales bacterium OH1046]|nr:hypothetical protein EII22_08965 [Coriobacteriales bacterium OH1046]
MRNIVYIGRDGCAMCESILDLVVAPLMDKYPDRITSHFSWDQDVERVNSRKPIDRVPLFVVERDGEEEFRFSGWLSADEIEEIATCDAGTLSLEDIRG